MPHPRNILGRLPALANKDRIDYAMFGWIQATRKLLPGVTILKTLEVFRKDFGLDESFNVPSNAKRYQKMLKAFYSGQRSDAEGLPDLSEDDFDDYEGRIFKVRVMGICLLIKVIGGK